MAEGGCLVIFRGLPGTGKSFLLKKVMGILRKAKPGLRLARTSRDELRHLILDEPTFDTSEKKMIDGMLVEISKELLLKHSPFYSFYYLRSYIVFVDGCSFTKRDGLLDFVAGAHASSSPWALVECSCRPEMAVKRIEKDVVNGSHPAKDRDSKLFWRCHSAWEASKLDPKHTLKVDTTIDADLYPNAQLVAAFIKKKCSEFKCARTSILSSML
eukprot:jgi/Bigna1/84884/estExt_fgenesh1_pg.C_10279